MESEEKTTTVSIEISENLAVFASEYANMIGISMEKLLCKELRRGLKEIRARVRQLPFTNMENIIQAREDAVTLAVAKQIEANKNH
jgi:hypothetical protein